MPLNPCYPFQTLSLLVRINLTGITKYAQFSNNTIWVYFCNLSVCLTLRAVIA